MPADRGPVTFCLTGDVMTGRGIDQILRHPGDPRIYERWVQSAADYVTLGEQASGAIPRRVDPGYVWGDALTALRERSPDAFVVNLETAVTDSSTPWPGKPIQYRMHPANAEVLSVAGVDVAGLANNHVLDWSAPGLEQTLAVLEAAGVRTAGAGRDAAAAWGPARVPANAPATRVLVLAAGTASSGVPHDWAAGATRAGVAFLDVSDASVDRIGEIVASSASPGDVVVMSIHWGPNWGYAIDAAHREFAHALIDRAGVHVVHGHSSHHPLGLEVYGGRLILYGCGDLITDYEGIRGHEEYRGELSGLYFATFDATGVLERLEVVPTKMFRFQLTAPPPDDVRWLAGTLHRESSPFGASVTPTEDGTLRVRW